MLAAARIMHRLPVEFGAMLHRAFAARGKRTAIALAIVEVMIDMTVEMRSSVIPGARADEDAVSEPFRTVVSLGRAIIRRHFVIPVRTNRCDPDADGYPAVAAAADKKRNRGE